MGINRRDGGAFLAAHLAGPAHHVLVGRELLGAHGAAGVELVGGDADLGPEAELPPSANWVEALTSTMALSTAAVKRAAVAASSVTMASVWPEP